MVLKYQDIVPTSPAPGITRRILAHGGGMMGVEASFEKGAVGTIHRHPMSRSAMFCPEALSMKWKVRSTYFIRETATMSLPMKTTVQQRWKMRLFWTSLHLSAKIFCKSLINLYTTKMEVLHMKRAVITGATGGIGGKTAEVLGLTGYEVIVTGIDEAGRQAVMSNLESKGIKAHFYFCDATNEEQVNETFAKIAQEFDSLDLLVNNVGGLGGRQRVSEMETSFMRKVMALNFDSLFFNTRAALPLLKKGTNPSIINFSTIAVTNGGGIGASVYAASKGAVQSYSRALAKDLAEFGIRVNMVSPGTIDTPFHAATDRKLVESWKDSILMKRLGDPREVADVIEFLASDKASFLTGEVIQINGGQAFI